MHINLPDNISQLFILAFIVIILIIIVSPNERGLVASIIVILLAIGLDSNSKSTFKLNTKTDIDDTKQEESITAESLCTESPKYKGAIDCTDDFEPEKFKTEYKTNMYTSVDEDADYDIKSATQGLKRNDYTRSITGLIDTKKRIYERNDIREELDEAEMERWEGNDDY